MRLAAAGVRLLDELSESALEVLQVQVEVDDLIDGDGLRRSHGFTHRLRDGLLDFLNRPARDREHDDEGHLALRARDLEVETLLFVAEDLDIAAFEAAAADRAVVEPRTVADELDDAHRRPILRPEKRRRSVLTLALDAGAAGGSDHRGMNSAGGQNHPISRLQVEAPSLQLEHETDRSVDAVEDLLIGVAVGRVSVAGPVRPRVAAARLTPQLCHQVIEACHGPILRLQG